MIQKIQKIQIKIATFRNYSRIRMPTFLNGRCARHADHNYVCVRPYLGVARAALRGEGSLLEMTRAFRIGADSPMVTHFTKFSHRYY